MAIVINGSGTVTGLAVGGLPDGTVDSDTLASGAGGVAGVASSADATAITIDSSERVGIGIGNPTARLHVYNANDHVRLSAQCAQNTGQHWQFQSRNNGEFWIRNETTESNKFVMNTAGVVSIPNGIELGSGVDATAANTLDDYEEGTWTPVFSSNIAFGTKYNFTYTKIGRLVHITGYLAQASGTFGTSWNITGLPFTGSGNYNLAPLWSHGQDQDYMMYMNNGEAQINIRDRDDGNMNSMAEISVQCTYTTNQ